MTEETTRVTAFFGDTPGGVSGALCGAAPRPHLRVGRSTVAFAYDRYGHLFQEAHATSAAKLDQIRTTGLAADSDQQPVGRRPSNSGLLIRGDSP
ncbi:MAG TPA: hypothetical protein VIJ76_04660 [Galbitalea sp.]